MIVGRSPNCDVVVDHPYVSGRHLRIVCGVVVEDLGSSNGTFLNDNRLEGPEALGASRLTIGGPVIQLEVVASGEDSDQALAAEVTRLRARVAELEQAKNSDTTPPTRKVPIPAKNPSGEGESLLLQELVQNDFKDFQPRLEGTVTDFFILESFRLLRQVEKVVTRMAGELTTQLNLDTILPDAEGNFMALISDVMLNPTDPVCREELVAYLNQLRKWLFVALGAYQRASVKFAEELRASLSTSALTGIEPIPAAYRWFRLEEQILWRRACSYLDELSRNHVEDRLDELAKASAREMLGKPGRP